MALRALQVVSSLGLGGAETWLLSLVQHVGAERGGACLEIELLLTGDDVGALEPEFAQAKVPIHRLPFRRATLVPFAASFRALLRARRYDAIHDHQDYAAGLHFLAAAGALPTVRVAHVHNPMLRAVNVPRSALRRATTRLGQYGLTRLATHVLGTSEEVLSDYGFRSKEYRRQTVRPLHCGFDPGCFRQDSAACRASLLAELDLPAGRRIALFVGRVDAGADQKNAAFVLEIAREATRLDPRVVFLLAGEQGEAGVRLERAVAAWDDGGRVRFLGTRRDVPRLMAAAQVLLVPSHKEGLGMVIVEAQAAGLPVLASDAVPSESAVVPGRVQHLPLAAGALSWAQRMLDVLGRPRPDPGPDNALVAASPFAIATSAAALVEVYSAAGRDLR